MQRAKNRNDYNRAVGEFQHAVDAAPWWSSAYYNLALAREGAGDAIGAIEAYKWFLAAEPRAREAPVIRERIVALEVDAEDQARRRKLVGYWRSQSGSLVRSELTQDGLVVTAVAPSASARKFGYAAGQIYFQGAADGNRFKGTAGRVPCGDGAHSTCKRCFGDMRQYRATAALRGDDKLVVTTDDVWITQWNIHTCAVLNKQRFNQDEVYTRDKAEERNRAGS